MYRKMQTGRRFEASAGQLPKTARPPDGGGFSDWIDVVDWIDCVDSGQNGHG